MTRWYELMNGIYLNPTPEGVMQVYEKLKPNLNIMVMGYLFADRVYRIKDDDTAEPITADELDLSTSDCKMLLDILIGWCIAHQQLSEALHSRVSFPTEEQNEGRTDTTVE